MTAFGAPQWHNQRSQYDGLTIEGWQQVRKYMPMDQQYRYNPTYGFGKNGERMTSAKNFYHKPQISLNHQWQINHKSTLSTALYVSIGRGGGNSGQGRCWGAITGHAESNSDIRDVIVEDVLIYAEISGSTDKCYLGYIVGYNKGGKVLGSCIIDNCDNDLGGVNLIIKDTVKMQQCWFEVGNGAAGKNTSEHVPSDWKT